MEFLNKSIWAQDFLCGRFLSINSVSSQIFRLSLLESILVSCISYGICPFYLNCINVVTRLFRMSLFNFCHASSEISDYQNYMLLFLILVICLLSFVLG